MDTGQSPRFQGQSIQIGDRTFIAPSLSTKQARALWPVVMSFQAKVNAEQIPDRYQGGMQIIFASLSRNYPDLTLEELEDLVPVSEFMTVLQVVMKVSGLFTPGPEPAAIPSVSGQ